MLILLQYIDSNTVLNFFSHNFFTSSYMHSAYMYIVNIFLSPENKKHQTYFVNSTGSRYEYEIIYDSLYIFFWIFKFGKLFNA